MSDKSADGPDRGEELLSEAAQAELNYQRAMLTPPGEQSETTRQWARDRRDTTQDAYAAFMEAHTGPMETRQYVKMLILERALTIELQGWTIRRFPDYWFDNRYDEISTWPCGHGRWRTDTCDTCSWVNEII